MLLLALGEIGVSYEAGKPDTGDWQYSIELGMAVDAGVPA